MDQSGSFTGIRVCNNNPVILFHFNIASDCTGCLGFGSIQPKLYVITFVRVVYEFKF